MAIRNIRTEGDPVLRKVSRKVENFDDRLFLILEDMRDTLIKSEGIGLAAVQIGILRRIVLVNFNGRIIELINPEITEREGEQKEAEACLSLPGKAGKTVRPKTVTVKAQNRDGKWCIYKGTDLEARCFCHELDHLDGKLYIDSLAPGESVFFTQD
ncbi:MAG: peptide deformylase [Ruminococcaceae bacterium]|nr:peptide deformylase [Oscillospiraceae bacterium]MBR3597173.1 peptide deformylase [Clostridia bacterium]